MNRSPAAFRGALAMSATVLACSLAMVTAAPAVHARESSPPAPGPATSHVPSTPSDDGLPAGAEGPVAGTYAEALGFTVQHPGSRPRNTNDLHCRPAQGQRPVLLVPSTMEDAYATWSKLAPSLANDDLCVFTFNDNPLVVNGRPVEWAAFAGDIRSSALTLSWVVDRILGATGAESVDLVGHSQGGAHCRITTSRISAETGRSIGSCRSRALTKGRGWAERP